MIGIVITTRNRPNVLDYTLAKFKQFYTEDQLIIVIDDASETHKHNKAICKKHGVVYVLNEVRQGIPRTKEKGFRMLLHCDYQFWFDDDCFPKVENWTDPFIEAMEFQGHLLYIHPWSHIKKIQDLQNEIVEYSGATACLMTFRKDMYKDIHGMSVGRSLYGDWHWFVSQKMAKYGLCDFASILRAGEVIHSFDIDGMPYGFDYHFQSSLSPEERVRQ